MNSSSAYIVSAVVMLACLINPSSSHAGAVLSLVPTTTTVTFTNNPTEQFVIGVRLAASAANNGTQNVQGYTIPVDLHAPLGKGLPAGWTVTAVTPVANFSGGALFSANTNPGEGDALGGDVRLAGPLTFNTTPTTLFEFTVQVNRNTAANGDFTAAVFGNGALFSINDSAATTIPLNQIDFTNTALIRIVGVPEPGSLALVGCIGLGLACRAFRCCPKFSRLF